MASQAAEDWGAVMAELHALRKGDGLAVSPCDGRGAFLVHVSRFGGLVLRALEA